MRAVITQPNYIPNCHRFGMVASCDTFVFLDNVQFSKQSFQQRNRIMTQQGVKWLSVPCHKGVLLSDTRIDYTEDWPKKHLESIKQSYAKARYSSECLDVLSQWYTARPELLCDLTEGLMIDLARLMGFMPQWVRAQDLGIVEANPKERLRKILEAVNADEWLANTGDRELYKGFAGATFFEYRQPVYPQMHGEFVGNLSIIDLMLNVSNPADYVRAGCV